MLIKNDFTVPRSVDDVWAYLLDVEKVAPCMPGAELTETVDDRNWKGKLNMKFGPVAMSFAGTVALEERDDAAHRVKLHAKGMEQKGKGAANATVSASGPRSRRTRAPPSRTPLHPPPPRSPRNRSAGSASGWPRCGRAS